MARIPTAAEGGLGNLTAQAVNLPGVRPTFAAPSPLAAGAFGAGVGQAIQGFSRAGQGFGGTLLDIQTQQLIEKNEADAKNADLEYSKRVRDLMFGDGTQDNPGYYGLEGQNATEAFGATQTQLAAIREQVASGIENERVRKMYNESSAVRLDQELQRATLHNFQAGKKASVDASDARVKEFADDAVARYNDPAAVKQNKTAGVAEVINFWADRGADDDTVKTKVGEFTTEFHDAQVKRHLAGGDHLAAQAYFDKHIEEIDGRAHSKILEDIAKTVTTDTAGLKRDMRQNIAALNMGAHPAGLSQLMDAVDNTPVGMNGAFDNLRQDLLDAVTDQPIVAAQMKRPLGEVGDMLATFRAKMSSTDPANLPTIDELRQFEKIEKAHNAQAKMFADGNGLAVAANNGVIDPLGEMDFSAEAIALRVVQADAASEVYGLEVSPFLDAEVDALAGLITGEGQPTPPSVQEVSAILNNVQDGLGDDGASFMVRDLIEKDHPAIALALQTVSERPALAQEMIKGQRFLNENPEFAPRFQDKQAAGATSFGNLFTQDTLAARGDIMKAADGLYALRAAESGESVFNPSLYEEAILETIGGKVNHNGRDVIPPFPNMEQDDFDVLVRGVTNSTLMDENGELPKLGDGSDFTQQMLVSSIWRDEASLVSTSMDGTYHLLIPGVGYVQNGDQSAPFELNLRDVMASPSTDPFTPAPVGTFDQPFEDQMIDALLMAEDEQRTQRGLEGIYQGLPEPDFAEEDGEVPIPKKQPETMSQSKAFTASAEVVGLDDIPTKMFKDSVGVPTVGIGFNLLKEGAQEAIEGMGYDYAAVLSGKQEISRGDAVVLYQRDYAVAQGDAAAIIPNFDNLNHARKTVFTDMAFNMGRTDLAEFNRMLAAIAQEDWELAATEAEDSKWFKQVGRRGPRNVETIRTGVLQGFK